jgi:hypothetical protein
VEAASRDERRPLAEQAFRQASFSMSVVDAEPRYLRLNEVACQGTLISLRDVVARGKAVH